MKNKIFITGVAGFLGSHMADKFINEGWKVAGNDNLLGGYKDNIPEGVQFYNIDCMDLKEMTSAMNESDIVFHTACTAYEGLSVFSPDLITKNTFQIGVTAMTAAIRNKVKRFVNCSSMARYGSHKDGNVKFTENLECNPQDPYGIAKLSLEKILFNLGETHGIEIVNAVPHNIIGQRQKYDDPYRNVVSIMINLIAQNRQPIIYGDGNQVRCFSPIEDNIDCLYKIITSNKSSGHIFNIGPDHNPITINDLAYELGSLMNFKIDPIYVDPRPQEVKYATCSSDKIRKFFNYKPVITLEKSLLNTIDYVYKRGPKKFEYHLEIEIINSKTPKTWQKKFF